MTRRADPEDTKLIQKLSKSEHIQTYREYKICRLIYLRDEDIAVKEGINCRTIQGTISILLERFGVTNRLSLMRQLLDCGFTFNLQYLESREGAYNETGS